ncbi:MAG: tRNA synthetases class II (A)-domain-containing protein, partial [Olpidium bornovanus]
AQARDAGRKSISGVDVWQLYDTYGFPVDLTRLMAEENGMAVDELEFLAEQERAKERSRAGRAGSASAADIKLNVHAIAEVDRMNVKKTDDSFKYGKEQIEAKIVALYTGSDFVRSVGNEATIGVILDRTNFYAEAGGQEADHGTLAIDGRSDFAVETVQAYGGYVVHIGYLKYGELSVGDTVVCTYDELRRWPLRNNHTGTHILNFALAKVLGPAVDQKGSLVAPDKLRFDFTHKSPCTPAQLTEIERICQELVARNVPVFSREVPLAVAKAINGLRAVFGEVYPDPVRVISIGVPVEDLMADVGNPKWRETSVEFCGGTLVAVSVPGAKKWSVNIVDSLTTFSVAQS